MFTIREDTTIITFSKVLLILHLTSFKYWNLQNNLANYVVSRAAPGSMTNVAHEEEEVSYSLSQSP